LREWRIDHHPDIDVVVRQADKILAREHRAELPLQYAGVLGADPKHNEIADFFPGRRVHWLVGRVTGQKNVFAGEVVVTL
jgi:hypothetical protein